MWCERREWCTCSRKKDPKLQPPGKAVDCGIRNHSLGHDFGQWRFLVGQSLPRGFRLLLKFSDVLGIVFVEHKILRQTKAGFATVVWSGLMRRFNKLATNYHATPNDVCVRSFPPVNTGRHFQHSQIFLEEKNYSPPYNFSSWIGCKTTHRNL